MNKVLSTYLKICLFLLPILYLPVSVDMINFGKGWFFLVSEILGLFIWLIASLIKKDEFVIRTNKAWWWMFLLTIWAGIWWWMMLPGARMRSFTGIPGMGMILGITIWSFLWLQLKKQDYESEENWLTVGVLVSAIISLVVFLIPTNKMPLVWPKNNPLISLNVGWTLMGSLWSEFWLFLLVTIIWIRRLFIKQKNKQNYGGEIMVSAIMVLSFSLNIFRLIQTKISFLDWHSGWIIAVESLKNKALQGIGIGNYLEAFNRWRPDSFNSTPVWQLGYNWAPNLGMQIWTELGLVGLLIAIFGSLAIIKGQTSKGEKVVSVILLLILWLSPINLVVAIVALWWLSRGIVGHEKKLEMRVGENETNIAPVLLAIIVFVGGSWVLYWMGRILLGEIYYKRSQVSAMANDGVKTYETQIKAIQANPYNAEYRVTYSLTNMNLAVGILSGKEVSEEQKQQGQVLIEQAVREAKAATALDSANADCWSNLAAVYQPLIGSVDGVADWIYQALTQAISLNPTDPGLKLSLGQISFGAGRYEEAERIFEESVKVKIDLANSWYNWAHAAKKLNKLSEAVYRLNQAVTLVPRDSGDYEQANKELEAWSKELEELMAKQKEAAEAEAKAKAPETLTNPEAVPTGALEEDIVPKESIQLPETITPTP